MKIKIEDLKPLRLYGSEKEGSTLSLKVGKPDTLNGGAVDDRIEDSPDEETIGSVFLSTDSTYVFRPNGGAEG